MDPAVYGIRVLHVQNNVHDMNNDFIYYIIMYKCIKVLFIDFK